MKRFTLAIFALILLFPVNAEAVSTKDCTFDTAQCRCFPSDIELFPITSDEACYNACRGYAQNPEFASIATWSIQCEVDERVAVVATGMIEEEEEVIEENDKSAAPILGVAIPGLNFKDGDNGNYIGLYVEALYKYLLAVGGFIAVLMFSVAGLQWMTARGDASKVTQAKDRMANASFGIILLFGAFTIGFMISPDTVVFESLDVLKIGRVEFDFPNETPSGMLLNSPYALSSTAATGSVGWNGVAIYNQQDWPSTPYGEAECLTTTTGTIKSSGCAPTSYAMVASTILGTRIDPVSVANEWAQIDSCADLGIEGYSGKCRACPDANVCGGCNGTFGAAVAYSELAKRLGVIGTPVGTSGQRLSDAEKNDMYQKLASGDYLAISSYKTELGNGHFIVITGVDEDGNFLINNSWGGMMEVRDPDSYFYVMKSAFLFER